MTRRWVSVCLTLGLLLPLPARAEAVLARYEVRAAGLSVMQVEALLDLAGPRYLIRASNRISGLMGNFPGGDNVK